MPLTHGQGRTTDREILRLAVPAFAALVAEPLFLLTDYAIVGRLGTSALGALSVAGTILATIVNLCVFLAYGTTAAVARQVGAGNHRQAVQRGMDGVWLAAAIGVGVVVVCWPLAPGLVGLIDAPPEVTADAITYLRISLVGTPAMLIVLAGTGVLRGLQDTVTPLAVSVGGFALNAALNAWFVLGLGWGLAGSAWGTVAAQSLAAGAYLIVVVRGARRVRASLRPDPAGIKASGTAGVALLIRTVCLRIVLVTATVIAARLGIAEVAAHGITTQVWTLLAFALDAIAIAGQALTGKLLGAGDVLGARRVTGRMVMWGVVSGVVLGLAVIGCRPFIPGIFAAEPAVAAQIDAVLWTVALFQPIAGVVFVLDGVLIGAGDQRYLAWAAAVTTLAYLPFALLAGSLVGLWLAIGVWMLARLATLGLRARGDAWLVSGA
ncbi:MATE family efflux transporter [Acrocarpospora macrocephala]|uniref:MATE family efflux transporter n=1 Tax=Acrocarpospora macrocephala TaxID=150177 RepID=A0A5M3WFV5_9ACTN|nr:MATE family efflux transporter [Acrocarpospora macrocephala]GES07854.1 MATE family efflux transporter [Acrocarpospora macrocephala]